MRALVLGCGGTVGGAWSVGALHAFARDGGWDPREADLMIGTSGGSALVALLDGGVSTDELVAAQRGEQSARGAVRELFVSPPPPTPGRPRLRPTSLGLVRHGLRARRPLVAGAGLLPRGRAVADFLDPVAEELAPTWHRERAWLMATDVHTGELVPFGAPGSPAATLPEAMRASWGIPGWFAPTTIGGRDYVDGGVASSTSAHLLVGTPVDEVVIVAPMISLAPGRPRGLGQRGESLLRRAMSRVVADEIAALEADGKVVHLVTPTLGEREAMGWHYMKPRRRLAALEAGLGHRTPHLEELS